MWIFHHDFDRNFNRNFNFVQRMTAGIGCVVVACYAAGAFALVAIALYVLSRI